MSCFLSLLATRSASAAFGRLGLTRIYGGSIHVQQVREKSKAKKLEIKMKKRQERLANAKEFVPKDVLLKAKLGARSIGEKESILAHKPVSTNDALVFKETLTLHFNEILRYLRELNGPDIYDNTEGLVQAELEMDMRTDKVAKFKGNFSKTIVLPHHFHVEREKNLVIAFCESEEDIQAALQAGAVHAGGVVLTKQIEKGEISSYEFTHCVSTAEMYPYVNKLRKILKDRVPSQKDGQIGNDMPSMVTHFILGKTITTNTDFGPEVGFTRVNLGPLSMCDEELQANLIGYLDALEAFKGYKKHDYGRFVFRAKITILGCNENFLLYLPTAKLNPDDAAQFSLTEEAETHEPEEDVHKDTDDAAVAQQASEAQPAVEDSEKAYEARLKEERRLMTMGEKPYKAYKKELYESTLKKRQEVREYEEQLAAIYRLKRLGRLSETTQKNIDLDRQYRLPLRV